MNTETPKVEPSCLACGHATAHNETEYEDTHRRCGEVTNREPYPCEKHAVFNPDCEEIDDCFEILSYCRCSSEDRQIASLLAENEQLRKERDRVAADAIAEHEAALCPEDVGCAELITTLRTRVEELTRERSWISVKDRLPEENRNILVRSDNQCTYTAVRDGGRWWYFGGGFGEELRYNVTHWMPLPSSPTNAETE